MQEWYDKYFWAKGSGLLPIHLSPLLHKKQFILLDGGRYDFCLDLTDDEAPISHYYSAAWSSDVKNFIKVGKEEATVYNWSRNKADKVPLRLVAEKFPAFLKILDSTNYRTSEDIAPFVLGLFAQLRNITQEKKDPIAALNLLFKLLVSIEETDLSRNTCETWGIESMPLPDGFDRIVETLKKGFRGITPNLDFILRHGSGPLFESAHREALYFDSQLDLFGGISSNLTYSMSSGYSSIHYTPRYLVRSIVEDALKHLDLSKPILKVMDPACGSGTFLQETLKQLKELGYAGKVVVKGYDISLMATMTTKFLLSYEQRTLWDRQLELDIVRCDSLDADWGIQDLILMNPPFISSELIKDTETKDKVNAVLAGLNMKHRPNMAAAFFYKAFRSLDAGGVLGMVIPSSILIQEQYRPLREAVTESANLSTVAQLGNFVFENALVDTSFVILDKNKDKYNLPLNIWCNNKESSAFEAMKGWRKMYYEGLPAKIEQNYNIFIPSRFPIVTGSWKVLSEKDDLFVKSLASMLRNGSLKPLIHVFEVKQGIIKGDKDLFEIGEYEYSQLTESEQHLFRSIASSETIKPGYVTSGHYLWYPYDLNGLMIKTEDELRKHEWSYNWLLEHKETLQHRQGVKNWWELTRPRNEQFKKEIRLCSKRSGSVRSFAIIPDNYVVEEGNVFLFRTQNYELDDMYFYLSYFSSNTFERLLSIYARPLKAGFDLGKIQIKDIPIVDVADYGIRSSEAYKSLVEFGKEYALGYTSLQEHFDRYVLSFYSAL